MDVAIDFWADVRDVAQIQKPGYKRCFVFFRISRAVIVLRHPGKWLALYLDEQVNAAMEQTDAPNHTNLQLHLRRSCLRDFL